MGHALRRAGYWDEAAAAFVAAISGARGVNPTGLTVPTDVDEAPSAKPYWYYQLALCLRKRGDLAGAAKMLQAACRREPTNVRWLTLLAQVAEEAEEAEEAGDLAATVAALQGLVEAGSGDGDPRLRLKLASLHGEVGQWDTAQRLLAENVRAHPAHAPSYKRLAGVLTAMSRWGGTFTGTLAGRASGRFQPGPPSVSGDDPAVSASAAARSALERAVELKPGKPTWRFDLAEARAADGDLAGAAEQYEIAVSEAERSNGRWALGVKQRWQFRLERSYHLLGKGRVADPLFSCELRPIGGWADGSQSTPGLFDAQLTQLGMRIRGFVANEDCEHVELLLNGALVRTVNVSRDGFLPQFSLYLVRKTLARFPADGELEVRSSAGASLRGPAGAEKLRLAMPHGDGSLLEILAGGGKVDKKGVISPSTAETRQHQDRLLEVYSRVRDFFEERFGRQVFLMYGTLLGYHRDGDFIPDDDDFDAGYLSDQTDPVAVKEETKELIVALIHAGFTVSFNPRGRLFRIQLDRRTNEGLHVDIRPLWFEDGNVWAHNHVRLRLGRDDFLPVVDGSLRGVPVYVPRNTEAFLRGYYGPGWKVPDPGFTYYASDVDPAIRRQLARALITVPEYQQLAERLHRETGGSPEAGRFVSCGSQNLYPLAEFITE